MLATQPLRYFVNRALGWQRPLEDVAVESWVIEPETSAIAPPATYLADGLQRITGVGSFSDLPHQMKTIQGGAVVHREIRVFRIRDAVLLHGNLYSSRSRTLLKDGSPRLSRQILAAERIPAASLAATYFGSLYFGHWLSDDLPLALLAAEHALPVCTDQPRTAHQTEYLSLAGLDVRPCGAALVRDLLVFDDRGQTPSKLRRYMELRRRLSARTATAPGSPRIFLGRGTRGQKRHLVNEDEICRALLARGFKVLHPETMSVAELLAEIGGCKVVVGVEGSHLMHALFAMDTGGAFCALQPPDRFSNAIKWYADTLGARYGFVVGHARGEGSFEVKVDDVLRVLDLLVT